MSEYPQRLRRQAQALGSGGQFDYVAASGTSTPSAIAAINASMRQNAANNKVAEDDANVQWRRENAEDVYNTLKDLKHDAEDFDDQISGMDPRALQLPGVSARVADLKGRNDDYKSEVKAMLAEENKSWDELEKDAKAYGTREEYLSIKEMREGDEYDISDAQALADGEDGFYSRHDKAKITQEEKDAYDAAEAAANKTFDRKTTTLNRINKRKIAKRDRLEGRLAQAGLNKDKLDGTVDATAESKSKAGSVVEGLEKQLEGVEEELQGYYEGINSAEAELDGFYNPTEKAEEAEQATIRQILGDPDKSDAEPDED